MTSRRVQLEAQLQVLYVPEVLSQFDTYLCQSVTLHRRLCACLSLFLTVCLSLLLPLSYSHTITHSLTVLDSMYHNVSWAVKTAISLFSLSEFVEKAICLISLYLSQTHSLTHCLF